jgi:uncharacterized protein (TIGR03000 family)
MIRHIFPIVTTGLTLALFASAPTRGHAQWPVGMNYRGPGAGGFGGGYGQRGGYGQFGGGGINPYVGVYLPPQGGYGYGGYDPTVASVPSAAYFTYGRTSYTTESPSPIPVYDPRPAYAPMPPAMPLTALLQVQVPIDAEVWLEGQKMRSTGALRHFRSPPLNPAKGYVYEVRVRWPSDGKTVEDVRPTAIRAGATVYVDFTRHEVPVSKSKDGAAPKPKPSEDAAKSPPGKDAG